MFAESCDDRSSFNVHLQATPLSLKLKSLSLSVPPAWASEVAPRATQRWAAIINRLATSLSLPDIGTAKPAHAERERSASSARCGFPDEEFSAARCAPAAAASSRFAPQARVIALAAAPALSKLD
jgi:hypothetical protein